MATHYEVLGVASNCSQAEIKQAYHAAILASHPDKQRSSDMTSQFQDVHAAYQALRQVDTRRAYDLLLQENKLKQEVRISDEIDLDDMTYIENEETYSYSCRCGDSYNITVDELEEGMDVVPCDGCSLNIRVVYRQQ
ncbi:hypothetical protein THRCLA_20501 [Thraustotheca clavata]|uniref:Diphthamide biosynthesis protein 4 n=1 Tax=Thraustotheca clavata TaxID=74557 RepID=A0A1W0A6J7_9STRA|nr:hypothetical protein THRCLA_20501 [Thraustotheca clavata]